jgi:hypothetical protein
VRMHAHWCVCDLCLRACVCVCVCVWGGGRGLIPVYHKVIVLEGVDCIYLTVNRDH